ncbi:hypothetical protein PXK00_18540 [Phaeobacter sp. QD34_3]|uniref:hypothetical protein n=1 Tax=unclassified Phaeobacter TaxID=2621772 RepID=UPI00237F0786|nr:MULTISPECIES: hypothetical protein [unclassified Phaeobacter]MDE4135107.1 hypothetical protein [Phaeobacter sp. QD34_3]MDE4138740.1 hypothetical protein [Phaeobacter sp. QD34_24]
MRISSGEISDELWDAIGVQSATVAATLDTAIEENRMGADFSLYEILTVDSGTQITLA